MRTGEGFRTSILKEKQSEIDVQCFPTISCVSLCNFLYREIRFSHCVIVLTAFADALPVSRADALSLILTVVVTHST